ncbi:MAG: DUF167 domain-containing protein [Nitrosopumilus sp.]|nr:DUF167 domain-containing protein [Nitrosopumilus sp.]
MIYTVSVSFYKEFFEVNGNHTNIGSKSKPIKGETNRELIKKIERYFQISSSKVLLKKGHKTTEKIIEIMQ